MVCTFPATSKFTKLCSCYNIRNIFKKGSVSTTSRLAQLVEHETLNLRVVGSSPTLGDLVFGNFLIL